MQFRLSQLLINSRVVFIFTRHRLLPKTSEASRRVSGSWSVGFSKTKCPGQQPAPLATPCVEVRTWNENDSCKELSPRRFGWLQPQVAELHFTKVQESFEEAIGVQNILYLINAFSNWWIERNSWRTYCYKHYKRRQLTEDVANHVLDLSWAEEWRKHGVRTAHLIWCKGELGYRRGGHYTGCETYRRRPGNQHKSLGCLSPEFVRYWYLAFHWFLIVL